MNPDTEGPAEKQRSGLREYSRSECVTFRKTKEKFGGLSNMAAGFPIRIANTTWRTSEALYQALKFPNDSAVQLKILAEKSPMSAKMVAKPFARLARPDWEKVRTKVMRFCLHLKLLQNWESFGDLLSETGDKPIVEDSRKDGFWGAIPSSPDYLVGRNVLGRLLMELRESFRSAQGRWSDVEAPEGVSLTLLDAHISRVDIVGNVQPSVESVPGAPMIASRTIELQTSVQSDGDLIKQAIRTAIEHAASLGTFTLAALAKELSVPLPWLKHHAESLQSEGIISLHKRGRSLMLDRFKGIPVEQGSFFENFRPAPKTDE